MPRSATLWTNGAQAFTVHAVDDAARFRRRVGRRIQVIRTAQGLSQTELARRMPGPEFVDGSQISRWENGRALPNQHNLQRLARALEVPIEAFFSDPPEGKKPRPGGG